MPEDIKVAKIWEDGLRTDPDKKSFEWWYLDCNLTDGSTIVVTFFTKAPSNPGGPITPQVSVTINQVNGEKLSFNKYYSKEEFSASKDKCDVKIGPNSFIGDLKKYKIHIELPEINADIELERVAPSYSTSVHPHSLKPEYFGWFCAVPFGRVEAKVAYSGTEKTLKGTGYHDHNWGIINIKQVCNYWYWGRGNAGDYSIIYTVMFLPKILGGKEPSVFYLAKGDKILIESNDLKLTKTNLNPPTPKVGHLPKELTFSFQDAQYSVNINLSNPKLIESEDPLQGEPLLTKMITRIFSKPLYVRYNADLNLEITEKNKTQKIKGMGLYEIMILH